MTPDIKATHPRHNSTDALLLALKMRLSEMYTTKTQVIH